MFHLVSVRSTNPIVLSSESIESARKTTAKHPTMSNQEKELIKLFMPASRLELVNSFQRVSMNHENHSQVKEDEI